MCWAQSASESGRKPTEAFQGENSTIVDFDTENRKRQQAACQVIPRQAENSSINQARLLRQFSCVSHVSDLPDFFHHHVVSLTRILVSPRSPLARWRGFILRLGLSSSSVACILPQRIVDVPPLLHPRFSSGGPGPPFWGKNVVSGGRDYE